MRPIKGPTRVTVKIKWVNTSKKTHRQQKPLELCVDYKYYEELPILDKAYSK